MGLRIALAVTLLSLATVAWAAEPVRAVASFSILGDLVCEVGGERVTLSTLVGPDGDAHVYQPTPADARSVAQADIMFINGLGFEGWIERLVQAADFKGTLVTASEGVKPLELAEEADNHDDDHNDHGEIDPHAWQDPTNVKRYVANIVAGLSAVDPAGSAIYQANADRYGAQLDALDTEARAAFAAVPEAQRKVITSHDAFGYFASAYGVKFLAPVGFSTEAEASAADVAALIREIRANDIGAVFVENISDPRLLEQISRETQAVVGGTLYSDALSGSDGPAATYLDLFSHNLRLLTGALAP
ncbi:MAG: zinc ABC transporter substrate-binding protein [Candidatus Competibacteraceae bacterium]|nr:zinc ABC transporter substrate-binding protein [Candidatus Competibacteraceae bacterium]